jgi:hypothetical protein
MHTVMLHVNEILWVNLLYLLFFVILKIIFPCNYDIKV